MHPMRLITYALLTSIVSLVAMGGIGFYVGYSAGRGDLEELKTLVAAGGSPENAEALAELLRQQDGAGTQAAADVDLNPLLDEIRSLSEQLGSIENQVAQRPEPSERVVEKIVEDPAAQAELVNIRQLLSETSDQYKVCRQNLTTLQTQFEELKTSTQVALTQDEQPNARTGSVVLFDNVLLTRNENKLYRDVDVSLSLQSMDSRSARVAVNRKPVGISFGERKIFQHRDVTCELVLMETDLEGGQARVSIACNR